MTTGSEPKIVMGWCGLGIVWKGGGAETRKGMPFWKFFLPNTCSQKNLEYDQITVLESILTVITTLGHCSAHGWRWFCHRLHKNNAPYNRNFAPWKKHVFLFQNLGVCMHAVTWSSGTFALLCAIFCRMDNGSILHIFFTFTTVFSQLLLIGCFVCHEVGTFRLDCGPAKRGGGARGRGAGRHRHR